MALAVKDIRKDDDKRVSDVGNRRRMERAANAMAKNYLASAIKQSDPLQSAMGSAFSQLAQQQQPVKAKATPPPQKEKPKAKVVTPKPQPKKVAKVVESSSSAAFSAEERANYLKAREFDHACYLTQMDSPAVLSQRHQKVKHKRPTGKVSRITNEVTVESSRLLEIHLERMYEFESQCLLADDNNQYDLVYVDNAENIVIGGITLGKNVRREAVPVPATGISKAATKAYLQRSHSIRSRLPKAEVKQPVVEAVTELEDMPPWQEDAISKGAASLEHEFDTYSVFSSTPEERLVHREWGYQHRNQRANLRAKMLRKQISARVKSHGQLGYTALVHIPQPEDSGLGQRYADGLATANTVGAPFYSCSNDDHQPTPPATPVAKQISDWTALEGDDLDDELRLCFQALASREKVQGQHLKPDTIEHLQMKYGFETTAEAWMANKLAKKIYGRNKARKIKQAAVKGEKVHALKNKFYKLEAKKLFRADLEHQEHLDLRKDLGNALLKNELRRMEERLMSHPHGEAERYEKWLRLNTQNQRQETHDDLMVHLRLLDLADAFNGARVQARNTEKKNYRIARAFSLTRPQDNIYLDLPPSAAAPVVDAVADKVGQDNPDFLIAGDNVVPFQKGMATLTEGVSFPLSSYERRRVQETIAFMMESVKHHLRQGWVMPTSAIAS
jgi:hypothetical protein